LLGITLATLGYSAVQFATLARSFYDFNPGWRRRLATVLTFERGALASVILALVGFILNAVLFVHWIRGGLLLQEISYPGLFGLMLLILGFQTFTFTLLFQMIHLRHQRGQS
jgi:hypothetical protein